MFLFIAAFLIIEILIGFQLVSVQKPMANLREKHNFGDKWKML